MRRISFFRSITHNRIYCNYNYYHFYYIIIYSLICFSSTIIYFSIYFLFSNSYDIIVNILWLRTTIYKKGSVWFDAVENIISCVFPLQTTRKKQAIRRIERSTDCMDCDRNGVCVRDAVSRHVPTLGIFLSSAYWFVPLHLLPPTIGSGTAGSTLPPPPAKRIWSCMLSDSSKNTMRRTILLSWGLCCHNAMIILLD